MIWVTSDEHYYHHNILMHRGSAPQAEPQARRFRTTDEMHLILKKRHNELVAPEDIVYHLGDFAYGPGAKSWQNLTDIMRKLNGTHHLILGNHDHLKPFDYIEAGFTSVHTSLVLDGVVLIHDPAAAGVLTDRNFIHGHTHALGKRLNSNTFCVCVELSDYYPIKLEEITFDT